MAFRHRGIQVVVDTTITAEFDITDRQLTDDFLTGVERNFVTLPFSKNDICEGNLRARTLDGFDFFFIVERIGAELVVTIGGVQSHVSESALRKALKIADQVGMFRGATGL